MNHIFTFPIVFIGVLCLNSIYGLLKNYWKARKIGLPIVITPVSLLGPVWALIWALAGGLIEPMLLSLPFGMGNWVTYSGHTWFFNHGYDLHKKYGPAFVIVTPTEIEVVIADPETAADLNNRRKEFIKDKRMYKPLEIFGPNVDTLNGEAWQRHRRFTAPPFNERNNKLVWGESLNQAAGILSAWTSVAAVKDGVANTVSDTMILALHVLQSAGFGKSYHYESGVSRLEDGHVMTYKDALRLILGNIFTTVVISSATVLPSFLLPEKVKEIKIAVVEFKKYMVEMVEKEKTSLHEPHTKEKSNLLSVLIKLSEQEHDRSGRKGLTDSELFGNLFFYNLAGHDTTASTLAYAVVLMASDTRWQNWIRHELDAVFEGRECKYWEYEKAFPRLKRCLALMHETLRLYGPVPAISKYTESSATITIKGRRYPIPPKTWIPINHAAIHTLSEYWGEDSLTWRPDRWITNPSQDGSSLDLQTEELFQPPTGLFLPWTSGPRICPGRKFAQVEFVAVIAKLFQKHEVEPVLEHDETMKQARQRALDQANHSIVNMTLQMADPKNVKLAWKEVSIEKERRVRWEMA